MGWTRTFFFCALAGKPWLVSGRDLIGVFFLLVLVFGWPAPAITLSLSLSVRGTDFIVAMDIGRWAPNN